MKAGPRIGPAAEVGVYPHSRGKPGPSGRSIAAADGRRGAAPRCWATSRSIAAVCVQPSFPDCTSFRPSGRCRIVRRAAASPIVPALATEGPRPLGTAIAGDVMCATPALDVKTLLALFGRGPHGWGPVSYGEAAPGQERCVELPWTRSSAVDCRHAGTRVPASVCGQFCNLYWTPLVPRCTVARCDVSGSRVVVRILVRLESPRPVG